MTSELKKPSLIKILFNICPRCGEGTIFRGVYTLNEKCSECGYKFEREPGYFIGTAGISYSLGFFAILPLFLFLLLGDYKFLWVVLLPSIQLVIISPLLLRFSRLIWIYIDHRALYYYGS